MLVTAGLNDPRVTYWEAAKYVAKLRATKLDQNLLLLKTNMGAGHGGKSGRFDSLREIAEEYAFLLVVLGMTDTR
jgi:oligopeptidase B